MKYLSLMTLAGLLTLGACSHHHGMKSCCKKDKQACAKETCTKEKCAKNEKCKDDSCLKAEAKCTNESCHKKS